MDTSDPIKEIIAERCIEQSDDFGNPHQVRILVGKPVKDSRPGGDYACPFCIVGLGDGAVRWAYGVDSVQALMLVLRMIGATLDYHRSTGAVLSWLGDDDLGFAAMNKGQQ